MICQKDEKLQLKTIRSHALIQAIFTSLDKYENLLSPLPNRNPSWSHTNIRLCSDQANVFVGGCEISSRGLQ